MKTRVKRVVTAIESKATDNLDGLFKEAVSYIDTAASKGVIHRNNAARKVARLTKKVNNISQPKG